MPFAFFTYLALMMALIWGCEKLVNVIKVKIACKKAAKTKLNNSEPEKV